MGSWLHNTFNCDVVFTWRAVALAALSLPLFVRAARVAETLHWLGLDGLDNRRPRELSGGQQQRVALALAVVRRPKYLLLDEPLAVLDTPTRLRLRGELRQLLRQLGLPTILVTHDRFEALALGDDLVVLHAGGNVPQGAAPDVFSRPVNLAVTEITAVETILSGNIFGTRDGLVTVAVGDARLIALAGDFPVDAREVYIRIRAEDVILMRADAVQSSPSNRLAATVRSVGREGALALLAKKHGPLKDGWTNRNLVRSVARLGGFIGRRQDGEPGFKPSGRLAAVDADA